MDKTCTIPATVLAATIRVFSTYKTRLEREAAILSRSPERQAQAEEHRKLIEVVQRLLTFYSEL